MRGRIANLPHPIPERIARQREQPRPGVFAREIGEPVIGKPGYQFAITPSCSEADRQTRSDGLRRPALGKAASSSILSGL